MIRLDATITAGHPLGEVGADDDAKHRQAAPGEEVGTSLKP
jgi:hypothetical protein